MTGVFQYGIGAFPIRSSVFLLCMPCQGSVIRAWNMYAEKHERVPPRVDEPGVEGPRDCPVPTQRTKAAVFSGHYVTFVVALGLIILWAVSGPLFKFSDTWQLVINTSTTIVTFLMVFLIQNTQNRDSKAIHIKLDEIIRAMDRSDNRIIAAEEDSDEQLDEMERKFEKLKAQS